MTKKITGRIVYQDIEGGFWGIDAEDGKYQPMIMPEQLKSNGAKVSCTVEILDDQMSFHNWGTLCKVIGFTTISNP